MIGFFARRLKLQAHSAISSPRTGWSGRDATAVSALTARASPGDMGAIAAEFPGRQCD
jgi:hypothetical protein